MASSGAKWIAGFLLALATVLAVHAELPKPGHLELGEDEEWQVPARLADAQDTAFASRPSSLVADHPLDRIISLGVPAANFVQTLFREPSVWNRYRWRILLIAAVLLLETALIVGLLHERRRRCNAESDAHRRMAELAHMNRRATVGELSGAIAHELNQPLGAILRNTEAAEMILRSPTVDLAELKDILLDIKRDDERAGAMIRRLRRLFAKAPLEPQEINLNELLTEVFDFLSTQALARRITLSTALTPQSPRVGGDRIQLQQVILNLVINAMDAIGEAGSGERSIIGRTSLVGGASAGVSIEDSGPGVPLDKVTEIFEPFMTTKPAGMGMGLSIARTIIQSHGGSIWAENLRGGGAAFHFTLPLGRSVAPVVALQSPFGATCPEAAETAPGQG